MKNKLCTNCKAGIMCQCSKEEISKRKENKKEAINHPSHYLKNTGFEVIDVIKAWKLDFNLGNAVKYIARAGKKDPAKYNEDLSKAIWYINNLIETTKSQDKMDN